MLDGLEVDGRQRADVEAEFFEGRGIKFLGFCCDGWFGAHDDVFGCVGVRGEETPVHEAAVAEVRIIDLFGAPFEDFRDDFRAFGGTLEEELDCGGQESELNFG